MSSEVLCQRRAPGKYQSLRVNSRLLRRLTQIARRNVIFLEQPKHTAVHSLQNPHPASEYRGRDLVDIVEAAEDESFSRQSNVGARDFGTAGGSVSGVHLVAAGQVNHLLGELIARLLRDHDLVSDYVVNEPRTHRAGITQVGHLDRCGPMQKNPRPLMQRESLEIDRNVDSEITRQLGNFLILLRLHVNELIERVPERLGHLIVRTKSEIEGDNLKTLPIVSLKQPAREQGGCVVVEVRGEITNADFRCSRPPED